MDISFHWIHDRILQEHSIVFWKPGPTNLGDYHSKHHPIPHHIKVQHTNLNEPHSSQTTLQGCVNSPNCYTTCTSIGLSKGPTANLQQRGNNHFATAVTPITAARENPLVPLTKPLYPMICKPVDWIIILVTTFLSSITSLTTRPRNIQKVSVFQYPGHSKIRNNMVRNYRNPWTLFRTHHKHIKEIKRSDQRNIQEIDKLVYDNIFCWRKEQNLHDRDDYSPEVNIFPDKYLFGFYL